MKLHCPRVRLPSVEHTSRVMHSYSIVDFKNVKPWIEPLVLRRNAHARGADAECLIMGGVSGAAKLWSYISVERRVAPGRAKLERADARVFEICKDGQILIANIARKRTIKVLAIHGGEVRRKIGKVKYEI